MNASALPSGTVLSSRYRMVVFDLDGTLANSLPVAETVLAQACRHYRLPVPDGPQREALRAMDTRSMLRALGLRWWQVPGFIAHMRGLMAPLSGQVQLFEGIDGLLGRLQCSGIRLGLVTSNRADNVATILGAARMDRFETLRCGVPLLGKRHVLARLAARSGLPARSIVSVGDEQRDARASQQAGLDFVGVGWGFSPPHVLAPYSRHPVLAAPGELYGLLFPECAGSE